MLLLLARSFLFVRCVGPWSSVLLLGHSAFVAGTHRALIDRSSLLIAKVVLIVIES